MAGGDIAFEYMQIGYADRRFCNFDDSVRRLDERGLGALQKGYFPHAVIDESFHHEMSSLLGCAGATIFGPSKQG